MRTTPFRSSSARLPGPSTRLPLASGATHFNDAVQRLTTFWQNFRSHQVIRSDWPGVVRQASRFVSHNLLGIGGPAPVALLDSSPLRGLLEAHLNLDGIGHSLAAEQLRAVAITAFGYESGQAVTFYQGRGSIEAWLRHRRIGLPTQLTIDHLLASAAIPLLFAPVQLGDEFYGDGAVRQSAPISPALHLGASRVLVVGVSGNPQRPAPPLPTQRVFSGQQPSLAQIGGHMLNSTFIDSLEDDIELLQRLNHLSRLLPAHLDARRLGLAPIDVLVVAPSQPLDEIAARHRRELPAALRLFLRGPGATRTSGAGVLSYLLFEASYCSELIELGRRDALAKKRELCQFLGV